MISIETENYRTVEGWQMINFHNSNLKNYLIKTYIAHKKKGTLQLFYINFKYHASIYTNWRK